MPDPIDIAEIRIGSGCPLALIAGPCVLEDEEETLALARSLRDLAQAADLPFLFKASFDKANRTRGDSYRGPGLHKGLAWLARVREELGVAVTTDVHLPEQAAPVAEVAALLQVPAFLCRQTDLIQACGATGRPVNLKKGQFVAPSDMRWAAEKALAAGAAGVLITDRGTSFGYHDLVADLRAIPTLQDLGYPAVFDATHSVQAPGGEQGRTSGHRRFAGPLARAAVAAGADAVFMEVHPDPTRALSDAATQLPLAEVPALLRDLAAIARLVRSVAATHHQEGQ